MAFVSVNEASKLINKSIKTIYRHIDNGKLSCSHDKNGAKTIDTSELIRVYGFISTKNENVGKEKMSSEVNDNKRIIEILENENKALKELLISKEDHISSLKQAMTLIEYKEKEKPKKTGFFSFFKKNL